MQMFLLLVRLRMKGRGLLAALGAQMGLLAGDWIGNGMVTISQTSCCPMYRNRGYLPTSCVVSSWMSGWRKLFDLALRIASAKASRGTETLGSCQRLITTVIFGSNAVHSLGVSYLRRLLIVV